MNLTRENYYDVGSKDDLILSNSAISKIHQGQGGSYLKFEAFFDSEKEKIDSMSLERGRLFHKWMELGNDKFHIHMIEKPGGKMGEIAEILIEYGKEQEYTSCSDFDPIVYLDIAKEVDYGQTWKEDTRYNKIVDSVTHYVTEVLENQEKFGITQSVYDQLSKCKASIDDNAHVSKFFKKWVNNDDVTYCNSEVALTGVIGNYTFKALLDLLTVTIKDNKAYVKVIDYKTMGFSVDTYLGQYVPRFDMNYNIKYEHTGGTFLSYRTYRQLGIYAEIARQWIISKYPEIPTENIEVDAYIIAVETTGLFESRLYPINREYLMFGLQEAFAITKEVDEYVTWRDKRDAYRT